MPSKSIRRHRRSGSKSMVGMRRKRMTGMRRRVHRHKGAGTKYAGGRRVRHRRHRMIGSGGYEITGQIPLLGGLMQAIGDSVHGGSHDW